MSNIVHLSDKKQKNNPADISFDDYTDNLSKGFVKNLSNQKKKELLSKIKAILKSRNVAFRSTPPSDWKEKSRPFAIFFPEKKVVFTLGVVNKLKIEDGWINHKISDTEDAVLSVGKIINLIEDSQHG
ncbi:hypothetical protein SMY54_004218 [Cronobacter sakazakii]|nr:hypothetical protein [Cronobacter sakazakii]ELY5885889.1 hypothetical protein [Cronobacter sakazakii]